jgi:diacylglycerol kinase family enzyme
MKLLFIVNPISGGVDKTPFLKEAKALCNKYRIENYIFKTTGKEDEKLLKNVLETFKPDRVASVGGDGTTLFSSVNLLNTFIPLGIIPLGSANGMATELYVNPNPIEALRDLIMSNIIGELDMLIINDTYYSLHIGDVGVNAQMVKSYEKDKNRGMVTYAKYFIEELKNMNPFEIEVIANEETIKSKGVMVGICNSRKYGTGVPLNLSGNPMDGVFEVVIIKQLDSNTLLKAGLSKFDESFHDSHNGIVISTNKATIRFDQPRLLQLDGEVIGEFQQLKIAVIPGAVKLITNTENLYLH